MNNTDREQLINWIKNIYVSNSHHTYKATMDDINNHGRNIVFIGDEQNCNYIPVPTNADYIRNMNNNELAEIIPCPMNISNFQCPISIAITCKECKRQWLKQPMKGGGDE
jgi:hypothetical protein